MNTTNTDIDKGQVQFKVLFRDFIFWLRYLKSKFWIIVIFSFLGAMLGFLIAYIKPPTYTATSTFVLEEGDGGGGLGQYAGIASMVGIDIGGVGGLFQGDNILELYKSRTMIEKALMSSSSEEDNTQLIDMYLNFKGLKEKWRDDPKLSTIKFNASLDKRNERLRDSILGVAVSDILKNILSVAKPDKKLSVIKVDVKSQSESFSKLFNDQIVKNVNEFYILTKTKKTLQNVLILQNKTDSVRSVMNGSVYKAAEIADATPNLNPTRQVQRTAPMQLSQISAEANKTILSELIKNLELTKMSLLRDTPLIQVIDQPIYPLEVKKFSSILATLIGMFLFGMGTIFILTIRRLIVNMK